MLRALPNQEAKKRVRKLLLKLTRMAAHTGVIPLIPKFQMELPGSGYHSGGSFPMSAQPKVGEADTLGRPYGMRRIHAIDSTILPSIPATTITYTVMANAYRIGTLAGTTMDRSGE